MVKKVILKSFEEILLMRESAHIVSRTLGELAKHIRPGVTTQALDKLAEEFIRDMGAIPGFKGLYGCPSTILASIDDAVIHGLPTDVPLEEGMVVSVDCGAILHGYYGDHAYTFAVGEISADKAKLLAVTKESLYLGIAQAKIGNRIGDISFAVQSYCEQHGFSVVREFVGHGLGKTLHEAPEVPNYGRKGHGKALQNGMTLAIEPMINMGKKEIKILADGWTTVTRDGKPSAHFEHDIAIWDGKPWVLSTFDFVEDVLGIAHSTPRWPADVLV